MNTTPGTAANSDARKRNDENRGPAIREREALVRELVTLFGPGTFGTTGGPELYEFEAERIADVLLAAGWSRPVPAAGEAAAEDVVERLRSEYDLNDNEIASLRDLAVETIAWGLLDLTSDVSDRWPSAAAVAEAQSDTRAAVDRLLAGGVPGRSEGEIKAEALQEAAVAMRRAKEPYHWNLRDPFDPDRAYSPDVWLERCAAAYGGWVLAEFDRWLAEIKAEGWDEAVRECHALGWLHDFALSDALARNPYHAAPSPCRRRRTFAPKRSKS